MTCGSHPASVVGERERYLVGLLDDSDGHRSAGVHRLQAVGDQVHHDLLDSGPLISRKQGVVRLKRTMRSL